MSRASLACGFSWLAGASTVGVIWFATSGDWAGAIAAVFLGFPCGIFALVYADNEASA